MMPMFEHHDNDNFANNRPALYWTDDSGERQERSYRAYYGYGLQMSSLLASQGLRPGDRIALVAGNTPPMAIALLACLQAGFTAVPLSPRFPPTTLAALLHLTNARAILHDDTTEHLCSESASELKIPLINLNQADDTTDRPANALPIAHHHRLPRDMTQAATVLCTSGSTGLPKAMLHTVGQHYFSAVGSAENIPFGEGDCWLAGLPMYHVGGYSIVFRALVGGAAIAFPEYRSFDVQGLKRTLEHFPITHCSFVATQLFHALGDAALVSQLRDLKAILLGGSAIPQALIQSALESGLPIYTSYGCTEMASQITTTASSTPHDLETSGKLLKFRELTLAEDGEILVRGATLAEGRLTTTGIIPITDENGWFRTNDIGSFDAEGRLRVVGRKDTMFISGGENIHPEAIERQLCEYPSVVQAIVVPIADTAFGARPVAFIQFADTTECPEDRIEPLRRLVEAKLPRFAVPRLFFAMPPEMVAGGLKPNRSDLQHLAGEIVLGS
jgi:O-succinylbenzoic acid--CoA ligase